MAQSWNPPPPPGMYAEKPNNNLAIAIIATVLSFVFCCIPHGLISLIFALQVDKKAAAGDIAGAINSARQAKIFGFISIGVAAIALVISIFFGVLNAVLSGIGHM